MMHFSGGLADVEGRGVASECREGALEDWFVGNRRARVGCHATHGTPAWRHCVIQVRVKMQNACH